MPDDAKPIQLEPGEYALIVGEEEGSFTIRISGGEGQPDDAPLSEAAELIAALAQRLLDDPEFHDQVLDWWDSQDDGDEAEDTKPDA